MKTGSGVKVTVGSSVAVNVAVGMDVAAGSGCVAVGAEREGKAVSTGKPGVEPLHPDNANSIAKAIKPDLDHMTPIITP